jgi:type IV secretion system protein VirB10
MRRLIAVGALTVVSWAQLKTREPETRKEPQSGPLWILPAGTRLPIQLRQPLSTKGAQPGDPVYAQTSFPVVVDGGIAVPAGTWVQGEVDSVKRAGRIKGTAELQFHLTKLIYANGYTVDIAAAIDQVPGDPNSSMKEPGTVKRDSEKGKDLERVGTAASQGGQIGALAGAAGGGSVRSLGVGGLAGIAAGTLIAMLARGSDVRFETGTAVEIALARPMAIEREKAARAGGAPPQ